MIDGWLKIILMTGCVLLAAGIILSMIRAGWGPRFTDRVVAVNLIGSITIIIMCLLSVYLEQDFLVDVAIVFALLSFIAIVVLTRLVIVRQRAQEERERVQGAAAAQPTQANTQGGAEK